MNDVISLGHRSQLVKNFLKHVIHDSKEIIRKKSLYYKKLCFISRADKVRKNFDHAPSVSIFKPVEICV